MVSSIRRPLLRRAAGGGEGDQGGPAARRRPLPSHPRHRRAAHARLPTRRRRSGRGARSRRSHRLCRGDPISGRFRGCHRRGLSAGIVAGRARRGLGGTSDWPHAAPLRVIGELYGLWRSAKKNKLDDEQRQSWRQERARPILKRIHAYLQEIAVTALRKSPLGDAIGYALRQWDALNRYTEAASLEIDNNGAENALRPLCLGRKNWLNFGSEKAAHRAMVLLTLVQTCKAHQVDPFAHLRDIIDRVSTHPMSRIDELTPRRWKELRRSRSAHAA